MSAWKCTNCGESIALNDDDDEPPLPCLVCDSDAWERVDDGDVEDDDPPVAADGGTATVDAFVVDTAAFAAAGCNCVHLPDDARCSFCRREGRLTVRGSFRDPTKAPAEAFADDRLTRRRRWSR